MRKFLNKSETVQSVDWIFTFEQHIPVVFINNYKYNCIRGYTV
jgi:hypothetical protein